MSHKLSEIRRYYKLNIIMRKIKLIVSWFEDGDIKISHIKIFLYILSRKISLFKYIHIFLRAIFIIFKITKKKKS